MTYHRLLEFARSITHCSNGGKLSKVSESTHVFLGTEDMQVFPCNEQNSKNSPEKGDAPAA